MRFEEANKISLPEWYLLRVTNQSDPKKQLSLSLFGGLSEREKPVLQIRQEAKKALRAGYKKILLPWNFLQHRDFQNLKSLVLEDPPCWAVQVHLNHWNAFKNQCKELLTEQTLTFDFLLEGPENSIWADLQQLPHFQITIPARRGVNIKEIVKSLPSYLHSKTCIHFPCFHKKHPKLYSSQEMSDFLTERFFPPPKIDIFNLSIPENLKLEPEMEPDFCYTIPKSKPQISVIIPSYNCGKSLLEVLRHLAGQPLAKESFEIIVIDDGSQDNSPKVLQEAFFLKELNFKYSLLPRAKKRRLGDHCFRAGIARNLGVKQALGDNLAFLDSDILVGGRLPFFHFKSYGKSQCSATPTIPFKTRSGQELPKNKPFRSHLYKRKRLLGTILLPQQRTGTHWSYLGNTFPQTPSVSGKKFSIQWAVSAKITPLTDLRTRIWVGGFII